MQSKRQSVSQPGERTVEIYRRAAQIFREKGYDATSVSDIARALGLTKPGLYHYISGKKGLLFDIMNFGLDQVERDVVGPARALADPDARLRALIVNHARIAVRGHGAITTLVDEVKALTPAQRRKITARKRAYFDFLRTTLTDLRAQGKLRDINPTVAAFSLIGMILWPSRWFRPDGSLSDEDVAREISEIALGGLLRPAARAESRGLRVVAGRVSGE